MANECILLGFNMQFLSNYGMFLLQTITLVVAILVLFAGIIALASKGKGHEKGKISIKKLNDKFKENQKILEEVVFDKKALKKIKKQQKSQKKSLKKSKSKDESRKKRVYVINFAGDIRANAVESLRSEVSALLAVAEPSDEVLINLESGGGVVNGYGLGASQLERIRQKNIPLTIAIDKVAASGGYMMACVANKIIAAPFAIIGSIGVVAQIPNFNRLLKKNHIDFEQITAGEFKRTLTMFGENTDKAREKMRQDIEDIHHHFKDFVAENRPALDIEAVATGEYWLAKKAKTLNLVDELITSDDYLMNQCQSADLFEIKYKPKKSLANKMTDSMSVLFKYFQEF